MEIPLSSFEIEVLNRVIPTQTFSDPARLKFALLDIVEEDKAHLIRSGIVNEQEFKFLKIQTAKNIVQFLRSQEFFYEREGGVFFLTEKVKHLRQQGTLQKYYEWELSDRGENARILHEIETRGYLNKDQDPAEHENDNWKKLDTLDYPVLDENNPYARHVHHKAHKFGLRGVLKSKRPEDTKKIAYILIVIVVIVVLLVITQKK
jgi:hypothetical protein